MLITRSHERSLDSFSDVEPDASMPLIRRKRVMTAEEYERLMGEAPENDDLERVNCEKAGQLGHWMCGTCKRCGRPVFACCACAKETR